MFFLLNSYSLSNCLAYVLRLYIINYIMNKLCSKFMVPEACFNTSGLCIFAERYVFGLLIAVVR